MDSLKQAPVVPRGGLDKIRVRTKPMPEQPQTPADFFDFMPLGAEPNALTNAIFALRERGALHARLTAIDHERWPDLHPFYPEGYWLEGWRDAHPNELPFGDEYEGVIWPNLTAQSEPTT